MWMPGYILSLTSGLLIGLFELLLLPCCRTSFFMAFIKSFPSVNFVGIPALVGYSTP